MAGYLFYPTADAAQDMIWSDTLERWGEAQAIVYIRDLHAHLQRLSERQSLWRRLPGKLVIPPDLKLQAYFSRYKRHYLFFRPLPNEIIGIMSILHERMNMPIRLAQDLASLSGDGSEL